MNKLTDFKQQNHKNYSIFNSRYVTIISVYNNYSIRIHWNERGFYLMKIIKNYLYNVIYQLFVIIVPLVTVPYISRVLGPSQVGINAYTNSIVTYFVLFGSVGVLLYGNRTVAYRRDNKYELTKVFWEITLLRALTISLATIAYLIYVLVIAQKYQTVLLAQSFLLFAAAFDISWLFMGLEDFKKTVVRNIMVKLISLIFIFTLVKNQDNLALYVVIITASQFIGNLTFWPYLKGILVKVKFSDLNIKQHFLPSIYLFIPQVATQVYLVLNRTMLGKMSTEIATGYYDSADKVVKVILSVVTATGTVMLPRVASTFANGNLKLVKKYLDISFDFVSLISFPLAFGIIAVSNNFSHLFFGPKFEGIESILSILAIVIIFISWSNAIGQQYLLPTNQMKPYTTSVVCGAISNFILNLLILARYGAIGAAISTVVAEGIVTMIQIYAVKNSINIKVLFKNVWKYAVSSLLMGVITYYVGIHYTGVFGLIIQVLIGGLVYGILILILKPTILTFMLDFLHKRKVNDGEV